MNRTPACGMSGFRRKHSAIPVIILMILAMGLIPSGIKPASGIIGQDSLLPDGSSWNGCQNYTSSCSATLTTSHGNDIIIAFGIEALNDLTACSFNVSDAAGLSWLPRSAIVFDQTGGSELQEFWARSINPVSSDIITESIIGCGTNYNALMVFGISGANFNIPFDPNSALPGTANGYSGSTSVQVSTSNPNDMIFAAVSHGNSAAFPTAGPGFTIITTTGLDAVEFQTNNSTVTDFPATFDDPVVDGWMSIGDAVEALSTAPDFSVTANPNALTINAGSSSNSTIMVSSFNGLSGTISLTATVSPNTVNGPSPSLNPVPRTNQ